MIKVINLSKSYGAFKAVNNLSFEIESSQIFGFVGPNGAGKTTTLKMLAGLLKRSAGSIIVDGADVSENPKLLRDKIGYMPDFFGVYDNLKVTEYLDFYAGTYYINSDRRPELIDNLLNLVDLDDKRLSYVDSLSRGMKQRLCLARSLIHDPEILLLDEPASGLDPRARIELKEILKKLSNMGKTILISSHILPELAEICTQVGIIDKGTMKATGTVNEILRSLKQKREITIKVLNMDMDFEKLFEERPLIHNIKFMQGLLSFEFDGEDIELADLITYIVTNGVKIIGIKENEGNLEEIFMQITGAEVETGAGGDLNAANS